MNSDRKGLGRLLNLTSIHCEDMSSCEWLKNLFKVSPGFKSVSMLEIRGFLKPPESYHIKKITNLPGNENRQV